MRRRQWRRTQPLRRAGKASPSGLMGANFLRDRLGWPAPADEFALIPLHEFQPVALRSQLQRSLSGYGHRASDGFGPHGGQTDPRRAVRMASLFPAVQQAELPG